MPLDLRVSLGPVLDAFGVPATVTPSGTGDPIETVVAWVEPGPDQGPAAAFQGTSQRRLLVVPKGEVETVDGTVAGVPGLKTGDVIQCPEVLEGDVLAWRVEGFDRAEADHYRANVVPTEFES